MTRDEVVKKSSALGDPFRLVRYLTRLMMDERVPRSAKLKVVGAGIYAWVDGDLVRDPTRLVPGVGYVDDLILVVHGVKCLIAETEPHVAAELWPGDEASFRRTMKAVKWLDDQLYGRVRDGLKWVAAKVAGASPSRSSISRPG